MLLSSKNLDDDDQNIEKKNCTLLLVYQFFNRVIVTHIWAKTLNLTIWYCCYLLVSIYFINNFEFLFAFLLSFNEWNHRNNMSDVGKNNILIYNIKTYVFFN